MVLQNQRLRNIVAKYQVIYECYLLLLFNNRIITNLLLLILTLHRVVLLQNG